jgi:hypothetical protein
VFVAAQKSKAFKRIQRRQDTGKIKPKERCVSRNKIYFAIIPAISALFPVASAVNIFLAKSPPEFFVDSRIFYVDAR